MNAFRVLALAYALTALLIAPAWITAEEPPAPDVIAAEEPAPGADPAVEPAPEPAAPAEEAPVAVEQEVDEPDAGSAAAAQAVKSQEDGDEKGEPVAKAAADGSVTISDFKFSPKTITVNVGDSITWTNEGPTMHTATANDGSFDTGNLDEGESGSATFNEAGTIPYICTPHPFMKGTVVVRAASSDSGDSAGTDTAGDDDTAGTTADDDSDGDSLPATGAETLAIALLGLATLGAGVLLRRRDQARS